MDATFKVTIQDTISNHYFLKELCQGTLVVFDQNYTEILLSYLEPRTLPEKFLTTATIYFFARRVIPGTFLVLS